MGLLARLGSLLTEEDKDPRLGRTGEKATFKGQTLGFKTDFGLAVY